MPEFSQSPPGPMTELQVSAYLMQLDTGLYCLYPAPESPAPDPDTGLPGARLSLPPGGGKRVALAGFDVDGWLGAGNAAVLIQVDDGPDDAQAQVMMTTYQMPGATAPPRFKLTRLTGGATAMPALAAAVPDRVADGMPTSSPEVLAHIQQRGDVIGQVGAWMGQPGSLHAIEGFALNPGGIGRDEIEYQAVLGRDWLSPWAAGGEFCGSRGMGLPILGLRARLRGAADATRTLRLDATFVDGTAVGPVGPGDACEAASLAPLEAFRIAIVANAQSASRGDVAG